MQHRTSCMVFTNFLIAARATLLAVAHVELLDLWHELLALASIHCKLHKVCGG